MNVNDSLLCLKASTLVASTESLLDQCNARFYGAEAMVLSYVRDNLQELIAMLEGRGTPKPWEFVTGGVVRVCSWCAHAAGVPTTSPRFICPSHLRALRLNVQ